MKITSVIISLLLVAGIVNAQLPGKIKTGEEYATPSGLKITFKTLEQKNKQALAGYKVKFNAIGKLTNDTVWINTYTHGAPLTLKVGNTQIMGLDEGLSYMHEGDSAYLCIPANLGPSRPLNKVPANSAVNMTVKVIKVIEPPSPFDTKGKDTTTLRNGLKYILLKRGDGEKLDSGMNVTVNYTGYFVDGKIFDSSVDRGEAAKLPLGNGTTLKGMEIGLKQLTVGSKARIIIPYYLGFGDTAVGPFPAKSTLIFDVEILKADKMLLPVTFDVKGKDTITTPTGLKYIVVKEGTGEQAAKGKSVKVQYTGYFLNGKIFDSSIQRGIPYEFTLGQGSVIAGWDEGIAYMKVGGKARLIIPYKLAYGEKGYSHIPPKTNLIFDVELIDVK